MKRIFTLVLSVLVLSVCTFATPEAVENAVEVDLTELYSEAETVAGGTCGTNLTWILDSEGTLAISGTGSMNEWTYYSSVPWNSKRASIKNIVIGDSVTSIGNYAFCNCTSLASIEIPDSVTSIGNYAFYECTSLASVKMGNSVTIIGGAAFCGCTSLASIEIPDSITSIGDSAFNGCTNLFFVYITDLKAWCEIDCKGTPLRDGAKLFLNGKAVKGDIVIPDGTTKVGNYSFYYCKDITSVTIPDSVTSIGYSAFYACSNLDCVYITDLGAWCNISSASYSDNPLYYAGKLYLNGQLLPDNVVIPSNATQIGEGAFLGLKIKSIEIPDSVTSIGYKAFNSCSNLTDITIGNGITRIDKFAFEYCSNIENVYISDFGSWCNIEFVIDYDVYSNPLMYADNVYLNGVKINELHIPSSVSTINNYAFINCDWIEKIYFSKGISKIQNSAFSSCDNIREIYYEGTADEWEMVAILSGNNALKKATLYTDYIPESHKVNFDANTDDEVENLPDTKFALGTFTFPEENPKRYGYRFLGWSESEDGEVQFTGGQKAEIYEEKTFYAVWEKKVTIFDNPLKLEAAPFFSADGKTATVVVNLLDSVGFGGLCFDVEYDEDILTLTGVTPAFASQYCTYDENTDGVVSFNITDEENIAGNGALALLSFGVADDVDSVFTEISIIPDKDGCFGYDEDDDYNKAPLAVEVVNGKIKPKGDFTGDGVVDMNDAILLLQHSMFPDLYPID